MDVLHALFFFFFFNDTATTEIYTLSLHDALPILKAVEFVQRHQIELAFDVVERLHVPADRKSTRLNSSHSQISYAVFCLKKKKKNALTHASSGYYDMIDAMLVADFVTRNLRSSYC